MNDAQAAFGRLLVLVGKREAQAYNDLGAWVLDYAACYGGVSIREVISDGGGQHIITERMSPREFVDACFFMRRVLAEAARR